MTIIMDDTEVKTLEQIRIILKSSQDLEFKGLSRDEKYGNRLAWGSGITVRRQTLADIILQFYSRIEQVRTRSI